MKNVPYKSFGKQMLLQCLGVANFATLLVSNLGYDSQQLGFVPNYLLDHSSICMIYQKVIATVKS